MRTTLDLPDKILRQLKAQAALNGLKFEELVTRFIQRNPYPIPIAREADGSVTPYLSNAELYAILDSEDIARYQRVLT